MDLCIWVFIFFNSKITEEIALLVMFAEQEWGQEFDTKSPSNNARTAVHQSSQCWASGDTRTPGACWTTSLVESKSYSLTQKHLSDKDTWCWPLTSTHVCTWTHASMRTNKHRTLSYSTHHNALPFLSSAIPRVYISQQPHKAGFPSRILTEAGREKICPHNPS